MSYQTARRATLASLVSQHIADNPHLKENILFWGLVDKCADTIACVQSAGIEIVFLTACILHNGERVTLVLKKDPFHIWIEERGDGMYHVSYGGTPDTSVRTNLDLLAYVKRRLHLH